MKVIGIVGSPRKGGNTEILTKFTLDLIAKEGIETELITLAGLDIKPCNACGVCRKEEKCTIEDDLFPIYLKMKAAEGIILSTPVYNGSATGLMKCFTERTSYISSGSGRVFSGKVGAPLVVARRAGHNFTFAQMLLWYTNQGLFIPSSTYWNIAFGRDKGEVMQDKEGLATAQNLAKNMAFLMKKLYG